MGRGMSENMEFVFMGGRGYGKSHNQLFLVMADGNPGCLQFICELMRIPGGWEAFRMMENMSIRGERAYKLWNDCCGRDTEMAAEILSLAGKRKITHEEICAHIDQPYGLPFDIEEIRMRKAQPIKEYRKVRVDMDVSDRGNQVMEKMRKDRAYNMVIEEMFRDSSEIGKNFMVTVEEHYENGILHLKATKEEVRKWM